MICNHCRDIVFSIAILKLLSNYLNLGLKLLKEMKFNLEKYPSSASANHIL